MDAETALNLRAGSMVWVKQRGFPWWPCMVTYDPDKGAYLIETKNTKKWHVQFFGEEPMRALVAASSIKHFCGPNEDADLKTGQKMSKRWLAAFPLAVEQADSSVEMTFMQRLGAFGCSFRDPTAAADDEEVVEKTRRLDDDESSDEDEPEEIWIQPDDPSKPKRGSSAYMLFGSDERKRLTAANPELGKDVCAMSKTIGAAWGSLGDAKKAKYAAAAAADKARYAMEMEAYVPPAKVLVVNPSKKEKRKADKQNGKKTKKWKDPAVSPLRQFFLSAVRMQSHATDCCPLRGG